MHISARLHEPRPPLATSARLLCFRMLLSTNTSGRSAGKSCCCGQAKHTTANKQQTQPRLHNHRWW